MRSITTTISFYAYGVLAIALLTIVSPMIILSVPTVIVLAWPTFMWWRRRRDRSRVPRAALALMLVVPLVPIVSGWYYLVHQLMVNPDQLDEAGTWAGVATTVFGPWLVAIIMFWYGRSTLAATDVPADVVAAPVQPVVDDVAYPPTDHAAVPPTPWSRWYDRSLESGDELSSPGS